ncbi:MAG TPA: hypothetical protein VJ165_01480 [candidate division Zixibacteria bacterium]|nr:hypothetical protein [candidate division Zixibacteria bacterium]
MWNDVIKIILGAIIGGFTTFFVQKKLKERNSLAYEILSKMSLIDVKDEVKKKIKIEYEEFPANNIYSFKIRLVNDGNVAIKNQPILFEFPKDCHILETKIDTKPRFEFGPITLDEKYEKGELDFHLERYIIDMVNPKDEIEFRFLTINNSNDAVKIHCKGENLRFHQIDRKTRAQLLSVITSAGGVLFGVAATIVSMEIFQQALTFPTIVSIWFVVIIIILGYMAYFIKRVSKTK